MTTTPTRAQAVAAAGAVVAEARRVRDSLPVEEAARQACTSTGPSYDELVQMIRAQRGLTKAAAA